MLYIEERRYLSFTLLPTRTSSLGGGGVIFQNKYIHRWSS